METEIKMICSASRVLSYTKEYPYAIEEEIFQDLSNYINEENIKDEKIIRCMIASASKALKIKRKTNLSEKQILKTVFEEIPQIVDNIDNSI